MEIWRAIEGYEGLYEISSEGNVRSLDRQSINRWGPYTIKGSIMHPCADNNGYMIIGLSRNNHKSPKKMHRLVAMAFPEICGEYREGYEVDHINGDKSDNRAINLRLVTPETNRANPVSIQKYYNSNKKRGRNISLARKGKNVPKRWIAISQYDLKGNHIADWPSISECKNNTGISHISCALSGRRKTAGGYIFKYKE